MLPARLPNLLINGTSGIAVGIATKIPPHNMGEVVAGLKALIRNPGITVRQLMQYIPAPDFPTGALCTLCALGGCTLRWHTAAACCAPRPDLQLGAPQGLYHVHAALGGGAPRQHGWLGGTGASPLAGAARTHAGCVPVLRGLLQPPILSLSQPPHPTPTQSHPTPHSTPGAGGEIILTDAVRQAYEEGRGGVLVRAKMHVEDGSGGGEGGRRRARRAAGGGSPAKPLVVITELPYQTNKVGSPCKSGCQIKNAGPALR